MIDLQRIDGFDWDEGNFDKNWKKHPVSNMECEELFFNVPLLSSDDESHSQKEKRYYALGQTNAKRWLFIACTIRETKIHVISARDSNQKEGSIHAEADPEI